MGQTLAVVVSYYPDKDLLIRNIESFLKYVDKVIIWENTPFYDAPRYRFIKDAKIEYLTEGKNVGISAALNFCLNYASKYGFEYFLSMDQDSYFDDFKIYKEKCVQMLSREECIIGPKTNATGLEDRFGCERPYIITSGTIARVSTLNKIGGYCKDFLVDAIDVELCFRAKTYNIPVYVYHGSSLNQQFGYPKEVYILGRKIVTCGYSTFRLEGIFRNHIITYKRYNHDPYVRRLLYVYYRHLIPGIIFIDNNKLKKLYAILKGTIKGMFFKV